MRAGQAEPQHLFDAIDSYFVGRDLEDVGVVNRDPLVVLLSQRHSVVAACGRSAMVVNHRAEPVLDRPSSALRRRQDARRKTELGVVPDDLVVLDGTPDTVVREALEVKHEYGREVFEEELLRSVDEAPAGSSVAVDGLWRSEVGQSILNGFDIVGLPPSPPPYQP